MSGNKIISNVFDIREIFSVLSAVVDDECIISVLEGGWKVSDAQPRYISSVTLDVPSDDFRDYHIERPSTIVLDTQEILSIMEDKRGDQSVEITIEPISENGAEKYKTKFSFGGISHSFISNKVNSEKRKTFPIATKGNANISISLDYFREVVKSCIRVSDWARFENDGSQIRVHSERDYGISAEAFIGEDVNEKVSSIFCLDDLQCMAKAIGDRNNSLISIYIGVEWPMTIKFKVCRHGEGTYVLAPRVDSEI